MSHAIKGFHDRTCYDSHKDSKKRLKIKMELKHLKLIGTVASVGTLTKASEVLFLSQSALSHQLKELESNLGFPLFDRVNNRLVLNEKGRIILHHSTSIFSELEKMEMQLNNIDPYAGSIIVAMEGYSSFNGLVPVVRAFNKMYPNVEVRIRSLGSGAIMKALRNEDIDFAITVSNPYESEIDTAPLFEDEIKVFMNKSHAYAKAPYIEMDWFKDAVIISQTDKDDHGIFIEKSLKDFQSTPKNRISVQSTEMVADMIKAGIGVSVLSSWVMKPYLNEDIVAIPLTEVGIKRYWFLNTLNNIEGETKHNFKQTIVEHLT